MIPILFALIMSFSFEFLKFIRLFSIMIEPELGRSINDSKFRRVDLPDPDGPIKE